MGRPFTLDNSTMSDNHVFAVLCVAAMLRNAVSAQTGVRLLCAPWQYLVLKCSGIIPVGSGMW